MVDEVIDLPKTDAKRKCNAFSSDSNSKKIIQSTYGFSMNKCRRTKNKMTKEIEISEKNLNISLNDDEGKAAKKEDTLWRSTLKKIDHLRYNGLRVIMKSYI